MSNDIEPWRGRLCESNCKKEIYLQSQAAAEKPTESGARSALDALFVADSVAIVGTTERSERNYENRAYQLADNPNTRFFNLVVLRSNLLCSRG